MKGIEVITGCMFSGKTTELISRLKNINADYLLIKPQIDNRGSDNKVSTHSGVAANAIKVNNRCCTICALNKKPSLISCIGDIKAISKIRMPEVKIVVSYELCVISLLFLGI